MAVAVRPTRGAAPDDTAHLFELYSERLLAYCLHVLRDRSEAEDAVQTTFLNAHRALQRGVTPLHEYAWLHTIAKNACRMQLRTKRRRAPLADVDVDTIAAQDDSDAGELKAALAQALAHLPDDQREAVVLRELHGLTPQEIAPRLGRSVPATYALLTRARRSLASALTTTVRGPLAVLDLVGITNVFRSLKAYLGGAASKTVVAAAVATTSVGVGSGVIVDRSLRDTPDRAQSGLSSAPTSPVASSASDGTVVGPPAEARPQPARSATDATVPHGDTTTLSGSSSAIPDATTPTPGGEVPPISDPTAPGEPGSPPRPEGADTSTSTRGEPAADNPLGLLELPPPLEEVVDATTSSVQVPPLPPLPPLSDLPADEQGSPATAPPPLPQLPLP